MFTPHALDVRFVPAYGQVLVRGAKTGKPLSAVYVKVYARHTDGSVEFYKDGYTDLRGHAIHRAGIEVDAAFRPLRQDGRPYDERLFAAGVIIAHQDWIRGRSGAGIAIATAFKAVTEAARYLSTRRAAATAGSSPP